MLFPAPSFLPKTLCKNMLSFRSVGETVSHTSSLRIYSFKRASLAAIVCTAVIALKFWRTCSVYAPRSKEEPLIAKLDAELPALRLRIFVLSTLATCCQ